MDREFVLEELSRLRMKSYNSKESTYKGFMRGVNQVLERILGVSSYDLPDATWRDYYEDELNPVDAVETAIEDGLLD